MELTDDIRKAIKSQLTAKPKRCKHKDQHRQRRTSAGLWVRPFHSDALGVNPEQIPEAIAALRAHGVTADFDKEGRCIITSEKQYREVAKATGMWEGAHGYHGGYNDEGKRQMTGREIERGKDEFRRAVERGDYDF